MPPEGIRHPGVDRMSGMSSILYIALYRKAFDSQRAEMKGEQPLGTLPSEESRSPFHSGRCARGHDRSGWILSMLLMPLMRMTPPFWMPESPRSAQDE